MKPEVGLGPRTFRGCFGLVLAAWHATQAWGATVTPPDGFGAPLTKSLVQVVHERSEGQMPNGVDRKSIEQVCAAQRELKLTDAVPLFESGWDQPNRTETTRFYNATHYVAMESQFVYECVASDIKRAPCGCTYKVVEHKYAHIRTRQAGVSESIDVDHGAGTALRASSAGGAGPVGLDKREALAAALASVGTDRVAGLGCTVRRLNMPEGRWLELCFTAADDQSIHPWIRARSLRSKLGADSEADDRSHLTRVTSIDAEAKVDEGVFRVPKGIDLRDSPFSKRRPQ